MHMDKSTICVFSKNRIIHHFLYNLREMTPLSVCEHSTLTVRAAVTPVYEHFICRLANSANDRNQYTKTACFHCKCIKC